MEDGSDPRALLSPRQLEVLRGVAALESSKEIAHRLGIEPATVDNHIAGAVRRLGTSSRREAAMLVARLDELGSVPSGVHPVPPPTPGGNPPPGLAGVSSGGRGVRSSTWWRRILKPAGSGRDAAPPRRGMGRLLIRYLLDGLYALVFFAIMTGGVWGVHRMIGVAEAAHFDQLELLILRIAGYLLALFDAVGAVTATFFLVFRFVRAIRSLDD